ncbi:MAG TPA: hypothetical protein VMV77_21640 [Bacteroidales bacterium]|nr:hypothetical protein [Bacteroidales bacterium]
MKKLSILFLFTILLTSASLSAQIVTKQAGIRTGYRSGIFYQMTNEAGNAEIGYNAMLSFNNNGIQLTGLRIIYETTLSEISPDLFFAWGYGGHVGFIYTDHLGFLGERYSFSGERLCPVIGADGWLAAEYRFRDIPLNISLNIKPFVELTIPAFVKIMPGDIGVSVSYVF